jgi:hypothetical protein
MYYILEEATSINKSKKEKENKNDIPKMDRKLDGTKKSVGEGIYLCGIFKHYSKSSASEVWYFGVDRNH